jgi:hypothetical protein
VLAGCRDRFAERRELERRPRVAELSPSAGTAPRDVRDGGSAIYESRAGIEVLATTSPGFDPYMRYDPTTVGTVRGPILGFERVPLVGDRTGLFVRINEGGDFPYIYLGPEEWLFSRDVTPDMTEQILATGSRVVRDGRIVIMARKIVLDGRELDLRDREGNPYWTEPVVVEREAY